MSFRSLILFFNASWVNDWNIVICRDFCIISAPYYAYITAENTNGRNSGWLLKTIMASEAKPLWTQANLGYQQPSRSFNI